MPFLEIFSRQALGPWRKVFSPRFCYPSDSHAAPLPLTSSTSWRVLTRKSSCIAGVSAP